MNMTAENMSTDLRDLSFDDYTAHTQMNNDDGDMLTMT